MKSNFVILRYNFLRDIWEIVWSSDSKRLAFVKYRQLKVGYPYYNYILREEVLLDEKH